MSTNLVDNVRGSGLTRAEYLMFEELIGQVSGLLLGEANWTPLRAALCERAAATGVSSFGEYYQLLRSAAGAGELSRLIELLTVHETAFFRNRAHFDLLTRSIVPELMRRNAASRTLRFWSAGCSTGQEAYSIAIALMESVRALDSWRVEVLATDISQRALETARAGTYSGRAVRNVDPVVLDRYFERHEGGYRVREQVRRLVRFEYLNLVKEPFPVAALSPCDVIFCENVTIYFKVESTRRVIRSFYDVLPEGGYLFLGYSETLWHISDEFALREIDDTFVYQKPTSDANVEGVAAPAAPTASRASRPAWLAPRAAPARRRESWARSPRPPERSATLEGAAALYEVRRYEEALLAVESVLTTSPSDAHAHLLAAKLRADREETGPAMRHCGRALEGDPLLEDGHYLMGVLLMRVGENRDAIESLSRVIYLNPSGHRAALAHFHLAGLHAGDNDRAGTTREYRNALRLLDRFPRDELVGEFSADFLARVCRRRLDELESSA